MPDILPHVLLVTPELLSPNDGRLLGIHERLRAIHEAGRLARFVIDEADKFLGVRQSLVILADSLTLAIACAL